MNDDTLVEINLRSGETCRISKSIAVESLRRLYAFYASQEKEWYKRTYHGDGCFNQGYEREWMKYREEAGSLAFAIRALTGCLPSEAPEKL